MRKCELSTKHQNMIDWCTLTLALTQSKYTCVRIYSSVKKILLASGSIIAPARKLIRWWANWGTIDFLHCTIAQELCPYIDSNKTDRTQNHAL